MAQQQEIKPKQSRPYVTLEYPYTDDTQNIFMVEQKQTHYRMEKDGRIIFPKFIGFSRSFRNMFTKAGYNFVPTKKIYPIGKKKIFGIPVTVRKIDQDDKKIIRIKIEGMTVDDVTEKVRRFEKEVRNIIHEDPEIKIWERLEMC